MNWITNRLSEPSSYAGFVGLIAGISGLFNGNFSWQNILYSLAGTAAFAIPEAMPIVNAIGAAVSTAQAASQAAANQADAAANSAKSASIAASTAVAATK